jgi:hypothetical protein
MTMKTKLTPVCVALSAIIAIWIAYGLLGNWLHWSSSGYPDATWYGRKMPQWKANVVAVFIRTPPWIVLSAFLVPVALWMKDRWCSVRAADWINVVTVVLMLWATVPIAQLSAWAMSPWSSRPHTHIDVFLGPL